MSIHVIGSIARSEISEFRKVCEERDWMIIEGLEDGAEVITYLDRSMNKHEIRIGDKTALMIVG